MGRPKALDDRRNDAFANLHGGVFVTRVDGQCRVDGIEVRAIYGENRPHVFVEVTAFFERRIRNLQDVGSGPSQGRCCRKRPGARNGLVRMEER